MVRVAGHFGEWLQGRLGPGGPVTLVTIPCAELCVTAERLGDGPLDLAGDAGTVGLADAAMFLAGLDLSQGTFHISAEMPAGGGAGASTATLVALARAAGFKGPAAILAKACLSTEGASDPLMYPHPDRLLWASREGRVIATIAPPPAAEIVGGFLGAPLRTDPSDNAFPDIADLVRAWRERPDLASCGALASRSAERTTELRGPTDDPMPELVRQTGALGHVRAHTGSARGLIFAPGQTPENADAILRGAGLTRVFRFRTGDAP